MATAPPLIRECWQIIHQMDDRQWAAGYQPLLQIERCLAYYDLPRLPAAPVQPEAALELSGIEPAFKNITHEILLALRLECYTLRQSEQVSQWAEKLMRYCEVRLSTLRKRSLEKCQTQPQAQHLLLHLAAFLMDQYSATQDLRLLNTALKLADQRWLVARKKLPGLLAGADRQSEPALFQFRLMLTTECALDQL